MLFIFAVSTHCILLRCLNSCLGVSASSCHSQLHIHAMPLGFAFPDLFFHSRELGMTYGTAT